MLWSLNVGRRWNVLYAIAVACAVAGCNRDDGTYKPPPLPTADALVDHFNSLTTKDPVNVVALHALYFAESDLQRDLVELDRKMTVMYDLDAAMQARFKEPWNPANPTAFVATPNEAATIIERQGNRAVAECVERNGTVTKLHLVENNGQWRLSGLTLENNEGLKLMVEAGRLKETDALLAPTALHGKRIADAVRAGQFATADDARKAMVSASGPAAVPGTQPAQ
jgi:hypothetical protein